MKRVVVACVVLLVGCAKHPPLDEDTVVYSIEHSPAFQSVDPAVVFIDAKVRPGPNTKRQMMSLEGFVVKDDGPFGLAGQTATATFTWRWTEGPHAGLVFRSKAKLNCVAGGTWKIYDDYLKDRLFASERGED